MGQSSSTTSKTALPSTNLLIDASESYVTDIKLKSTGVIPISAYIKKDKYSKNLQRLKEEKKSTPEEKANKLKEKDGKKSKLETINEEIKNEKDNKHEDNKKITQNEEIEVHIEDRKKEKQQFIESSYEDIPDKRKWINEHSTSKYHQSHCGTIVRNRKTQTKLYKPHNKILPNIEESNTSQESKDILSAEEIMQIYKNEVYPHVYKNKYKRRREKIQEELKKIEEDQKRSEQKKDEKKKINEPVESNMYISKTDIKKRPHKKEESTHHLTQHHFKRIAQFFKKPKLNNLVVQTNVACVIHPNKMYSQCPSKEKIKKPISATTKKYLSSLLRKDEDNKKHNIYECSSNASSANVPRKIDKVSVEHRKCLSGRQALAHWKNIHTLRQHRKLRQPSYETCTEENYKTNNRNPYSDTRYNIEYNTPTDTGPSMEYIVPPRKNRSRGGYRETPSIEIERMDRKPTPLEISNYNYSKMPPHVKMEYISPTEIKERNQRMKYQNHYEKLSSPRYEHIENSSYGGFPQQPRYLNHHSHNYNERPKMPPNNERYYRNNPLPEISDKDERNMDREDFIADIERCLQKHQKMASVYNKMQTPNKTTWVQDRYRRWHKVVVE